MMFALVEINNFAQFKHYSGTEYFSQLSNFTIQNFPNWARYFFPKWLGKGQKIYNGGTLYNELN
jgi:hypothetical protein